ncbi:TlpA disulfide reductase family protein [Homoserinimonas sp. OAct 916]|uniref:TlpA family protein disulfide reductase n=1 Tax=Homoserinimonas sp. OAct 916 TaxID=2211450 RepID=UPI000DBE18D9|nr:TlpA disulfide reductase family protein [Homoserinimonas sp. OAct 916]
MTDTSDLAPELDVSEWVGEPSPLESLRGRVVLIEAFQMLCPGCINYGLPQAQKVHRMLEGVTVIGLHTVFEHHAVTGPDALKVFLAEFGIQFPVGIDRHENDAMPVTMKRYQLQGTPSTLVIDRAGRLRLSHFGKIDDLALGSILGRLLDEDHDANPDAS